MKKNQKPAEIAAPRHSFCRLGRTCARKVIALELMAKGNPSKRIATRVPIATAAHHFILCGSAHYLISTRSRLSAAGRCSRGDCR